MKFNKTIKILGIGLLALLLIAIWIYVDFFRVDPQVENQLQQQFGQEYFNPVAPSAVLKDNEPLSPITRATLDKLEMIEQGQSQLDQSSRPSQELIVKKYLPRFAALEGTATGRLEGLFNSAGQEYKQQKAQGTLDKVGLARKYIQGASMLAKNVDSSFYSTVEEMKAELQHNNISTDIVKTISQEYEKAKSSKKRELVSRVKI